MGAKFSPDEHPAVADPSGNGNSHFVEALAHAAIDKDLKVAWSQPRAHWLPPSPGAKAEDQSRVVTGICRSDLIVVDSRRFTEYFNHSIAPDIVLQWPNEHCERLLFVRRRRTPTGCSTTCGSWRSTVPWCSLSKISPHHNRESIAPTRPCGLSARSLPTLAPGSRTRPDPEAIASVRQ